VGAVKLEPKSYDTVVITVRFTATTRYNILYSNMHKHKIKTTRAWTAPIVILAVALVGGYIVVNSRAATSIVSVQPESGTTRSSAVSCNDTTASGSKMIRFGSNDCTNPAIPQGQAFAWSKEFTSFPSYMDKMLRMKDDSWLRVKTINNGHPRTDLLFYKSTDNARTWTRIGSLNPRGREMDNGFLHYAPNGTLLLAARDIIWGTEAEIYQYHSNDGGATWQIDHLIDRFSGQGTRGVWEPNMYNLPDGRMVMLYADETYAKSLSSGYHQIAARLGVQKRSS
jgi:hypothetical protein